MAPYSALHSLHHHLSSTSGAGGRRRWSRVALAAIAGAACFASQTYATDASAFSVKVSSKGELVHWEERNVTYTIDPSVDANVDDGSRATIRAMGSWSGSVGAPALGTQPLDTTSPTSPAFDRKNGIFYMKDGYEPAGRALAITVLTYDNVTGKIMDADVIVNGIYNFKVLPPTEGQETLSAPLPDPNNTDTIVHADEGSDNYADVYDLHHVVAHELGHSLGMNDELNRSDDLMYRYSEPNDASMRAPNSDDLTGLSELYAQKADAQGSGCGSATVAPKKPSHDASNLAMYATLGLLLFLVVKARNDRRARFAFVAAATGAVVAFVPGLTGKRGVARADVSVSVASGAHARATVLGTTTAVEKGLFKTNYQLATTSCNIGACPKAGHGVTWGGTIGNITQEVGNQYAPQAGDAVDISFAAKSIPSVMTTLAKPLAGRPVAETDGAVRVLTRVVR